MPTTDELRAREAGHHVNQATHHAACALLELRQAREVTQGTPIGFISRVIDEPGIRSIDGRDISIAITELEGVLLRLKHGTPER